LENNNIDHRNDRENKIASGIYIYTFGSLTPPLSMTKKECQEECIRSLQQATMKILVIGCKGFIGRTRMIILRAPAMRFMGVMCWWNTTIHITSK